MKKLLPILTGGFIIWIVPLIVSFFFYNKDSVLLTPYWIFKTTMIILLIVTTWFVTRRLKQHNYITKDSYTTAAVWFLIISLGLDLIFLVPFLKLSLERYFMTIGWSYIFIPVVTTVVANDENS